MQVPTQWIQGLSSKDKTKFVETIAHNLDNPVIMKLVEILERQKEIEVSLLTETVDTEHQNYRIGSLKTYKTILQILEPWRTKS